MSETERRELERVIMTGLRSTVATHGAITLELLPSAAKRVFGELHAAGRLR